VAGPFGWFATGAGVGLAVFLWNKPSTPSFAVGDGAAGAAGVVAGEAAAVASFLDRFFGVALAAGLALVAVAALGLGLALCDRFFGLAEAVGLGLAV
jgi:hypothetical protein